MSLAVSHDLKEMPRRKLLQRHEDCLAAEAPAALEDLPAMQPGSGYVFPVLTQAIGWDNLGWARAQEVARATLLEILAAIRHKTLPEDLVTMAGLGASGNACQNAKRDAGRRLATRSEDASAIPFQSRLRRPKV